MATLATWIKLALTSFFWALMFFLGKYAVAWMSPESIGGWRFLLAGLLLVPLVSLREGVDWAGLRRHAVPVLVMAVVGIGGFNVALFHGLRQTQPMNAALIMALCPALITAFSAALTGDRLGRRQLAGLALGIVGVGVVISGASLSALLKLQLQSGDFFVLLAALCWAIYSTIPKRFISGLPPLQVTVGTVAAGGVVISLFAQATQRDFLVLPPVGVMVAVAAMSVFGSVVAYLWWNDGVKKVGAGRAAIFMNLVPVFAALIGVALGQSISHAQLAGAALVIGGVWLSSSRAVPAHAPTGLTLN